MNKKYATISIVLMLFAIAIATSAVFSQTPVFTYQGRLLDSSLAANGNYDLEFKLYDSESNGNLLDQRSRPNVAVSSGIFSVSLDFPATEFDGTDRFLEISVRPAGSSNPFTVLAPRQPITSAPYSVRSLSAASADLANNSDQLGGIGSNGFIHNGSAQQPGTDFNISGNGTAAGGLSGGIVNSGTSFTIGGVNVLSAPLENTFVGRSAGAFNTTGDHNSFFGQGAGAFNTTGFQNSFFGEGAGYSNNGGFFNSFFGYSAGVSNTSGSFNSFFGIQAGSANAGGFSNSYFGANAGASNLSGQNNSFFGTDAGFANTASNNSFFGLSAGQANTTGTLNSFFGYNSGLSNTTGFWNSFFGGQSGALNTTGSSNAFFGFNSGNANTTGINNSFFGQGAGFKNTTGQDNTFIGNGAGNNNDTASDNTFVGSLTGAGNTTGSNNSFLGQGAGYANTTGADNTFVGYEAGAGSTTFCCNSFFGSRAGQVTNSGTANAFFGYLAGGSNTSGSSNTFVGYNSGGTNNTGAINSFFGWQAGLGNTTGGANTFIGVSAGGNNTIGIYNTVLGTGANFGTVNLANATAIGALAEVDQNNSLVLGSINGVNGALADTNVGIGTPSPQAKLDIVGTTGLTRARISDSANAGLTLALNLQPKWTVATSSGTNNFFQIYNETLGQTAFFIDPNNNRVGIGTNNPQNLLDVNGVVRIGGLALGGSTAVCWNPSGQLSLCSSSLRYKKDIQPFKSGLALLDQLKPITFKWKADNSADLGFGAEDVAKVEPLLVTHNEKGEVEGVKYDRISAVLVNAVKEQQAQIAMEQKQIDQQASALEQQQRLIEHLERLISARNRHRSVGRKGGKR
jgi:hypothetical protein